MDIIIYSWSDTIIGRIGRSSSWWEIKNNNINNGDYSIISLVIGTEYDVYYILFAEKNEKDIWHNKDEFDEIHDMHNI